MMWTKPGHALRAINAVQKASDALIDAINATPSGEVRDRLTDANLSLIVALQPMHTAYGILADGNKLKKGAV